MRPIVCHRSSDKDLYLSRPRGLLQRSYVVQTPNESLGEPSSFFTHFTEVLSTLCTLSGRNYSMPSDFFLPYQAIEDLEIPLQPLQQHTKATTAILGLSTIPAHGQPTSNVSNHEEITHLSGARYHHSLEIQNLRRLARQIRSRAKFLHRSSIWTQIIPNEPFLAFLSGYSQKILGI